MTETMTDPIARIYKPGTRVRCVKGGAGFPGLLGTVTDAKSHACIHVEWDTPPSDDVNATGKYHGGTWNESSLQILDNAETEALRKENAFLLSRNSELHFALSEARGSLATSMAAEASLRDTAATYVNRIGTQGDEILATQYERDAMASVLLYALEHVDADSRQRVFGFWDAVL